MKPRKPTISGATALAISGLLAGCFPQDNDAEVYRAALPIQQAVAISGPETAQSAATAPSTDDPTAAPEGAPTSKYYAFTREVRDGVNRVTATILGTVWYIAHTKPTSIDDDEAIWGPNTDSLEPATWRFRVTRVAGEKYAYALEGRPKESKRDADYVVVLNGTGFGPDDDRHGDGTFTIDLDAAKALDPLAHASDSGTVTVTHDLPRTVTDEFAPLPRRIEVALAPSTDASHLDILSVANADNTGLLIVDGIADVDASHATALEDVMVASQWRADGAGRADVNIASGDVPAALSLVTAVECWDSKFKQSYYADSATIAPTVGSTEACAFTSPIMAE